MPKPTPYEAIYSYDKLHNSEPPLFKEPLDPMTELEMAHMQFGESLLNPGGDLPRVQLPQGAFYFRPSAPPTDKYGYTTRPIMSDPSGDEWEDAKNEYELIKKLNSVNNAHARRDFTNWRMGSR